MKIYPSLISADVLQLKMIIEQLNNHCDGYHLDIMDDHFVPNLTWGPMFINAISTATTLPLHVHLMVEKPETWISRLHLTNKDSFIFHIEAVSIDQAKIIIRQLKEQSIQVGIALNPKTPIASLESLLPLLDEALVMSVTPGFSGQTFIDVMKKVDELNDIKNTKNLNFIIGMDGGINHENINVIAQHGVSHVGVASAIFSHNDIIMALKKLREAL